MKTVLSLLLSIAFLNVYTATAENGQPSEHGEGLRCSINLTRTALRVGDPLVVELKIENVSDRSTHVYYPPIYQAKLLETRNEKGKILKPVETAVYGPPSVETIKKCFHLLKPAETFTARIPGRVAFEFVPSTAPAEKKTNRSVHIGFGDVAHHLDRPRRFMLRLRFSTDDRTVSLGETLRFRPVWSGDASVVPALVEALKDPNRWVGSYAAHSLAKLGGPEIIPALEELAKVAERDSQVEAAKQAIAMIRQRAASD